jgi:hypothetical protein
MNRKAWISPSEGDSSFCRVVSDEDLAEYDTLERMLADCYFPGNYNPTQDQARQLIRAAAVSAIRWARLHPAAADLYLTQR